MPTVKRIAGHETLMVERYARVNGEHLATAMDRLQNRATAGELIASLWAPIYTRI